jgi:hypothetical protein
VGGEVLSVHQRVCNVLTEPGAVTTLVAPEIGDGPFNVVLAGWQGSLSGVQVGMPVTCGPDRLLLGETEIVLASGLARGASSGLDATIGFLYLSRVVPNKFRDPSESST